MIRLKRVLEEKEQFRAEAWMEGKAEFEKEREQFNQVMEDKADLEPVSAEDYARWRAQKEFREAKEKLEADVLALIQAFESKYSVIMTNTMSTRLEKKDYDPKNINHGLPVFTATFSFTFGC